MRRVLVAGGERVVGDFQVGISQEVKMDDANIALIPQVLAARALSTLDLTGGAPELHPRFRALVMAARALGVTVIDRCNLTILSEPGFG